MNPIADLAKYNERMSKSMPDKLFFVDYISSEIFIDYGSADGEMIFWLEKLYPKAKFYGYDHNKQMCQTAEARQIPRSKFFHDFDDLMIDVIDNLGLKDRFTVILSSVVHEIISFKSLKEVYLFWDTITNLGADYIVLRDMAVTKEFYRERIPDKDVAKVTAQADRWQLLTFNNLWGPIHSGARFLHFLLKYPYKDNWARENQENYLLLVEDVENELERGKYTRVFQEHYTLPWVKERVLKDFDIDLTVPTHLKLIYKKE